jgi:hypothetical protein
MQVQTKGDKVTLLRRAVAIVAIAAGIGVTAGTASAAAATPTHHIKSTHVTHVVAHRIAHHVGPQPMDWWWL